MERAISATRANQHFSKIVREVAKGEPVTITSHGRPVVRIVPVEQGPTQDDRREALHALAQLPRISASKWRRDDLYD